MFGFGKRAPLQAIAGEEFVLGTGVWALRGKGSVRVFASDQGFDLKIGSSTLTQLNGVAWSASPFEMSAGFAGDAQFEGRNFAVVSGPFSILELPGEPWFGLNVELTEHRANDGPSLVSTIQLGLGITKDKRFKRALSDAQWMRGKRGRGKSGRTFRSGLTVVPERLLPAKHTAVSVAPELVAILLDPEGEVSPLEFMPHFQFAPRFTFPREEYEERLRQWHTMPIVVTDDDRPSTVSPSLRRLCSPVDNHSSLLLLPWLAAELALRCRGTPVFQLFENGLAWIDSNDETWQETLAEESARGKDDGGEACGPPLVFRDARWLNAVTALKAS